jgi:hypothetical protein
MFTWRLGEKGVRVELSRRARQRPEGATEGRPWAWPPGVKALISTRAPKGRRIFGSMVSVARRARTESALLIAYFVSPASPALGATSTLTPGLTPGATVCRASGARRFACYYGFAITNGFASNSRR